MYNGIALGPVIYDNPIYNMEIEKYRQFMKVKQYLDEQEERIRKKQEQDTSKEKPAETTPEQSSLGVQVFRGNTPVSPVIREARSPEMIMGDPQVYESDQGMYIKLPEGDFSIANFTIRVPECRRVYTRPNEYHEEYSVDVTHRGYTQKQAFLEAVQFLQICRKGEVALCLFLVAHLGPMFELFKAAGCLIRFVTVLVGPSGSLKTAVVTCLYNLFDKYGNAPVASFLDTVVYIEQTIARSIGCVQIIDDLRPPVTASESGLIAAKAEQIFRIFGDSNSKGRSSPNLQQRITPAPSCCGLITGEDIFGSNSSLLRCLILRIDKGDLTEAFFVCSRTTL